MILPRSTALRLLLAAGAAGPAIWLLWAAFVRQDLGADPVKTLQVVTGLAVLNLLLVTLAITPLRRYLTWNFLGQYRRMLGLSAFAYAVVHLLIYVVFDQSLDPRLIWDDTIEHPRIAVGALALLLLTPLAITSTDNMIRRLGKNWGRLHRLVYPATALGVLHYLMVQKLDLREGMIFAGVFGVLMLARLPLRRL
ncbi:MAG: sulfoxide reductase heme-binding subunit YedZ [Gemmatimonadales bacterium]|jgi:sulfoxide reductase heme-binding subunit YedZ|nr:MAG: sulfoxide reductase heme-binding subunit YedZ [Gemmatimonadales bacterium]